MIASLKQGSSLRFPLGQIVVMPGALESLTVAALRMDPIGAGVELMLGYLVRHASGDWRTVDESDWVANDRAVLMSGRILSAYQLPGGGKV